MTTLETPMDFRILSIGFTGKNAERFFTLLKEKKVKTLFDVRLQNTSQLAGFAKRDDLKYFLKNICEIDYIEVPELYPEATILRDYRNKAVSWDYYEAKYLELISKRSVERVLSPSLLDQGCLLCSEHKPHQCHRRLAIEYLKSRWAKNFKIEHLV